MVSYLYSDRELKHSDLKLRGYKYLEYLEKVAATKNSLASYIRLAWPIVEPATEYTHGWHIDAICLPYDSLIQTEDGPKKIGFLVENNWHGKVLSYNHQNNEIEWKAIKHRMKSPKKELLKIDTADNCLHITDNHPIFVKGKGYINADKVKVNDVIVRLSSVQERNTVLGKKADEILFKDMLLQKLKKHSARGAHILQVLLKKFLRFPSKEKSNFLQLGMLWKEQGSTYSTLQALLKKSGKKNNFLSKVLSFFEKEWNRVSMPTVRNASLLFSGAVGGIRSNYWRFLQPQMLGNIRERKKQPIVYRWIESAGLSSRIPENKEDNSKKREFYLFSLFKGLKTRYSSYRQRQEKQSSIKLSGSLQDLPQSSKRNKRESFNVSESIVKSIKRSLWIPKNVYNIEVEDNNNYFANGILVHNCEHLEAVTNGEILRLLINIPPGCMKSLILNVFWPSWEWGPRNMPHYRYISAAHNASLSIRDNIKLRRLVKSDWYKKNWPHVEIMGDQDAKIKFETTKLGFSEAIAAGSITGSRAHRVKIDDPLSVEDANSDTELSNKELWFNEAVPTRLVSPKESAIVVIMQRLHDKDTSGIILSDDFGYTHLMLPMEFERERKCITSIGFEDPRTEDGELLFPDRFPRDVVERDKKKMGSYAVACQLQQRPSAREGTIIKINWMTNRFILQYRQNGSLDLSDFREIYQSWDTAFKDGQQNDYSVCTTWGIKDDGFYLLHVLKERLLFPDLEKALISQAAIYNPNQILIEDKASGQSLVQAAQRRTRLPVKAVKWPGDKIARLHSISGYFDAMRVFFPQNASWFKDYHDEMTTFPTCTHDDQVDSTSQFFISIVLRREGIKQLPAGSTTTR